MRTWSVYALLDPRTGCVRYVGWAYEVHRRLGCHLSRARRETTHKDCWLRGLLALDLRPAIEVLEVGEGRGWADAERFWIASFRAAGADLTNRTDGGEGVGGLRFTAETREKMAAAKRGRKQTPEHIANAAKAKLGRIVSAATREKIAASKRGRRRGPEKVIVAKVDGRRRPLSEEHRQKLADAKRGRSLSDEHKARIRASSGGWKHSPEALEKIRAARRSRS